MKKLIILLLACSTTTLFSHSSFTDPCRRLVEDWHTLSEEQIKERMNELDDCKTKTNRKQIRQLTDDPFLNRTTRRSLRQINKKIDNEEKKGPETLDDVLELYFVRENTEISYWLSIAMRDYSHGKRVYTDRVKKEKCTPCWILAQNWEHEDHDERTKSAALEDCAEKLEQLIFVIKLMKANPQLRRSTIRRSLKEITDLINQRKGIDTLEAALERLAPRSILDVISDQYK